MSPQKRPASYSSEQGTKKIWVGDDAIINQHFARLTKLLAEEHKLDQERYKNEFLDKKPLEREKRGKALLHLAIVDRHFSPGGQRLLTFAYKNNRFLPRYTIGIGDVLRLSGFETKTNERPVGTVYDKDRKTITVSFKSFLPSWVGRDSSYDLNVAENQTTYERLFEAIKEVGMSKHTRTSLIRDISLGLKKPSSYDLLDSSKFKPLNPYLNDVQKKAVRMALSTEEVFLVHGPPGTGKTSVLVEIIRQAKKAGQSVLATAPSNAACDHLVESLSAHKVPVTRLGHPARITKSIREHTLSYKLVNHHLAKLIDKHHARLNQLDRQRERRRDRRTLSWEERQEMREEFRALRDDIKRLKAEIFQSVWSESDVVVATHTVAGDSVIKTRTFDWVIMDEATQAIEPSAWIAASRGHKLVLAGDHFQLPPTVFSPKTGKSSLRYTLFERLHEQLNNEYKLRLERQYRMHQKIMQFSSSEFYEGELKADSSVENHTISDLMDVKAKDEFTQEPVTYVDTAGMGYEEKREEGTGSLYNEDEAKLVIQEYQKLLKVGVPPNYIAIISPYSAQVKLMGNMILGQKEFTESSPLPEINSIDAFQGREKEVVVVSLVRSNSEGQIGFLSDTRRMNVALTRARRKLIVIGDSATISSHPFYDDFLKYCEKINAYRSGWEYTN